MVPRRVPSSAQTPEAAWWATVSALAWRVAVAGVVATARPLWVERCAAGFGNGHPPVTLRARDACRSRRRRTPRVMSARAARGVQRAAAATTAEVEVKGQRWQALPRPAARSAARAAGMAGMGAAAPQALVTRGGPASSARPPATTAAHGRPRVEQCSAAATAASPGAAGPAGLATLPWRPNSQQCCRGPATAPRSSRPSDARWRTGLSEPCLAATAMCATHARCARSASGRQRHCRTSQ